MARGDDRRQLEYSYVTAKLTPLPTGQSTRCRSRLASVNAATPPTPTQKAARGQRPGCGASFSAGSTNSVIAGSPMTIAKQTARTQKASCGLSCSMIRRRSSNVPATTAAWELAMPSNHRSPGCPRRTCSSHSGNTSLTFARFRVRRRDRRWSNGLDGLRPTLTRSTRSCRSRKFPRTQTRRNPPPLFAASSGPSLA